MFPENAAKLVWKLPCLDSTPALVGGGGVVEVRTFQLTRSSSYLEEG